MNSTFYGMIFKRKSFHIFRNVGSESISDDELNDIQNAYSGFIPLNPDIKTAIRMVPEKQTNCRRGGEYCVLLYSEKKDGYLQNIGYLGEQLDLYLVSRNIGTLWFGIGKTKQESFQDMEFIIMFSIRKISDDSKYRKDMLKSKRKSIDDIWEGERIAGVTDIVRFAPSACNSQPWFVRSDGILSVYRYKKPGKRGIMPARMVSFYNRIDIGIFICFMDICLEHSGICFEKTLYSDDGGDEQFVLNAEYRLDMTEENNKKEKIAGRDDWKTEPMPEARAAFVLDRSFSDQEMKALRRGNIPKAMEDKWFWYMEGSTLFAHRSWTGFCIYRIDFKGDGHLEVTVNRDPEQYGCTSIEEDIQSLNKLLDHWTQTSYDHYDQWLSETYDILKKTDKE